MQHTTCPLHPKLPFNIYELNDDLHKLEHDSSAATHWIESDISYSASDGYEYNDREFPGNWINSRLTAGEKNTKLSPPECESWAELHTYTVGSRGAMTSSNQSRPTFFSRRKKKWFSFKQILGIHHLCFLQPKRSAVGFIQLPFQIPTKSSIDSYLLFVMFPSCRCRPGAFTSFADGMRHV